MSKRNDSKNRNNAFPVSSGYLNKDEVIQEVIAYAKQNKFRLFIEVNPDYDKMYIYCDEFNIGDIADALRKIKKYIKINYISTNFWIKYNYYPEVVNLNQSKGKVIIRFWKQGVFDLIELSDKDLYFVDLNGVFQQTEKDILIDNIFDFKNLSLDEIKTQMDNILTTFGLENIEYNVYNDFGIIFYK